MNPKYLNRMHWWQLENFFYYYNYLRCYADAIFDFKEKHIGYEARIIQVYNSQKWQIRYKTKDDKSPSEFAVGGVTNLQKLFGYLHAKVTPRFKEEWKLGTGVANKLIFLDFEMKTFEKSPSPPLIYTRTHGHGHTHTHAHGHEHTHTHAHTLLFHRVE